MSGSDNFSGSSVIANIGVSVIFSSYSSVFYESLAIILIEQIFKKV